MVGRAFLFIYYSVDGGVVEILAEYFLDVWDIDVEEIPGAFVGEVDGEAAAGGGVSNGVFAGEVIGELAIGEE